jgi:hypothetical protein
LNDSNAEGVAPRHQKYDAEGTTTNRGERLHSTNEEDKHITKSSEKLRIGESSKYFLLGGGENCHLATKMCRIVELNEDDRPKGASALSASSDINWCVLHLVET